MDKIIYTGLEGTSFGKTFYRVCNLESKQGLWYNYDGDFTGLIHGEFNFCKNNKLQMPFDEDIKGWLSTTSTLDQLWAWFAERDVKELQKRGWFIHEYKAANWRYYEKFGHYLICQNTSRLVRKHKV